MARRLLAAAGCRANRVCSKERTAADWPATKAAHGHANRRHQRRCCRYRNQSGCRCHRRRVAAAAVAAAAAAATATATGAATTTASPTKAAGDCRQQARTPIIRAGSETSRGRLAKPDEYGRSPRTS